MSDVLSSLTRYSHFVYTLADRFPSIQRPTLVLRPTGTGFGETEGELAFRGEVRLRVREVVNFDLGRLHYYSYAVYCGEERKYWYDSQAHPNDPSLASTHPHHKHVPPDIKHNRVPAPGLSFEQPNLPVIIQEIETTLLAQCQPPPPATSA